ncbi:ComEC/Rec2 family competence protein [Planctomonas sp. JC2975]|uniref:ComEC/Rec2 family competence protein n=1 Tax=Planctomonas sp. JC2975 TaxID=2729626 RepID=UPI001474BC77|nr:ComEC/Rec2 family competence protein [Planctomonas sp. JC2975]NNC10790.1 ComEC/Rec2 family competence protein [Planctomonas sp. JC2975]
MHDLRLVLPALAAWMSAAVAIGMPEGLWFAIILWCVAVAAAGAAVTLRLRDQRDSDGFQRPSRRAVGRLATIAAAVCVAAAAAALVATAANAAMPSRRPDVIARLAHHTVTLRADVASMAQPSAASANAGGGVRFSATVTAISTGSASSTDATGATGSSGATEPTSSRDRPSGSVRMPVLVFAPMGTRVQIGQAVTVVGTVTLLPSGSETAGLVYASAKPRVVADPSALLSAMNGIRSGFSAQADGLPGDGGDLLPGLAIGDVHQLPAPLGDAMKAASLTHLTAVSGANCAVVVSLVGAAAAGLGFGRGIRAVSSLIALGGFVVLVTPQPSVLRAAVMAAVIVAGAWAGRPGRAVSALSLAIVVLLTIDPWLSVDYGFVLSVLATGALLLLAPPLAHKLERWLPARLAAILAVPIAAQVACQPVLLLLNPTVPLYGVLANLAAEPAAPIATVLGLSACLLLPLWPAAGAVLAHVAWIPSAWIAAVARVSAALPGSGLGWIDGAVGFVLMVLLTVAIVMLVISPTRRFAVMARAGALVAVAAIAACSLAGVAGSRVAEALSRPSHWNIAACDIGQGDAVLLQSGSAHALVDTGPDPDRLTACLDELGIHRIDLLVLTHYDMDHVGGTAAVIGRVGVAMVGPPVDDRGERLDAQLAAGGASVHVAQTGDAGRLGDADWRVLWPDTDRHGMTDGNERSVTMLFEGDGIRSLFLGDLDERAQDALLQTGRVPGVDVVKVSHHGSRDQSESLYQHLGASIGLISSGAGNDYGHPTATALGILRRVGTVVMRTDVQGILMVEASPDGGLKTWTQKHATAAQLAHPGTARGVAGGG